MFGGSTNNPSVVYYSSSVSESTTYRDGNVETTRKENFQSNIPGLVERVNENKREQRGISSNADAYYFDSIDEDISDMEEEIFDSVFDKGW